MAQKKMVQEGAFAKATWELFMWVVAIYFSIKHDHLP